jgi:fumarate reductase flavoprotein subunit
VETGFPKKIMLKQRDEIMEYFDADILILGAGGAGLRAAIAASQSAPDMTVALVSKVYPMRSHTVAAEGGSAGVVRPNDSLDNHFNDTVEGGDWLCEQDVVEYFVSHCTREMIQLEHWGCPWSRQADGHVNVRKFGGMKIERTWFAADRSGFHILHTLFQTSTQFPQISRFDEYFCVDLLVEDGRAQGAVVIATGGAGRVFRQNTNGGIVTGDGMALAYRHGVPLRDMEFVQYHPTCLPGTGILITEGCRGEGALLVNKDNYRYLQDYGLGPATPESRNKFMELGPRDRLSQAFWHEERKGRTVTTPQGEAVLLDLRHLGRAKLKERLPLICDLAKEFAGIDAATTAIPVRPAVHYTMGGILVDIDTATPLSGLFAAGECSSVGIHGPIGWDRIRWRNCRCSVASRASRQPHSRARRPPPDPAIRPARLRPRRLVCCNRKAVASVTPCCGPRWAPAWRRVAASIGSVRRCRRPATRWPG